MDHSPNSTKESATQIGNQSDIAQIKKNNIVEMDHCPSSIVKLCRLLRLFTVINRDSLRFKKTWFKWTISELKPQPISTMSESVLVKRGSDNIFALILTFFGPFFGFSIIAHSLADTVFSSL